jgi:hypothetical protein
VQEGSGAVLTQLKTIFYSIIAFTSLKMIRGIVNIVKKEIATEIIGPTRIIPLYLTRLIYHYYTLKLEKLQKI